MAMKGYKKGLKQPAEIEYERSRHWWRPKFGWPWDKRGSWKKLPPRRHPGWAAYHANKDQK